MKCGLSNVTVVGKFIKSRMDIKLGKERTGLGYSKVLLRLKKVLGASHLGDKLKLQRVKKYLFSLSKKSIQTLCMRCLISKEV